MRTTENDTLSSRLADTVERLEALIGQEAVSEDYVRFRIGLAKAQTSVREALVQHESSTVAGDAGATPTSPALTRGAIQWNRALLASLFEDVRALVVRSGKQTAGLAGLQEAAEENAGLLEELAEVSAFGDEESLLELSNRVGTAANVLLFVGRVLAAPFVAEAAHRRREVVAPVAASPESSGHCPVCGSPPALARLRQDDRRRILCCLLCEEKWAFARVECPFCANDDQGTMGLVTVTGVEAWWIEVCDKCKRYIKTVDEGKLSETEDVLPLVEDTATLYLDLIAQREGYARDVLDLVGEGN